MIDASFDFARAEDLNAAADLLGECGLPYQDIHHHVAGLILAKEGSRIVGSVACEAYADVGLLRSLAVRAGYRYRGLATELFSRIVAHARSQRIGRLFLLTTTAQGFFAKRGFEVLSRNDAPSAIAATEEFRSLCPSTAVCMSRWLDV